MLLFIFTMLLILAGATLMFLAYTGKLTAKTMNFETAMISGGISFAIGLILLLPTMLYSVDEGEAYVLTQFGRVYDTDTSPGLSIKRPWATRTKWTIRLSAMEEQLEARTKDDMMVTMHVTVWWRVSAEKLGDLYSNISKNEDSLVEGFVMPGLRSSIRDIIAKGEFNEINVGRERYADLITEHCQQELIKKYIIIDKVNIRNLTPPESVNTAIEEKLQMNQQAQKADHELELTIKQAQIRREEAKGIADAQAIIQTRLSPIYVQYEAIQMMKQLAGSNNTTFVFAPTSMSGIGLPAVYQSPIK